MKNFIPLALTATTCLTLIPHAAHALTWNFSGYSISDGANSYTASGSFALPNGFSGGFNINTPNIPSTLTVNVTTTAGTPANFSFNSGNINFGSSGFDGTVIGNTATFTSISLVTNNFDTFNDVNGVFQDYSNTNAGVSLSTLNAGTTGASFNNATANPTSSVPFEFKTTPGLIALFGIFGLKKLLDYLNNKK